MACTLSAKHQERHDPVRREWREARGASEQHHAWRPHCVRWHQLWQQVSLFVPDLAYIACPLQFGADRCELRPAEAVRLRAERADDCNYHRLPNSGLFFHPTNLSTAICTQPGHGSGFVFTVKVGYPGSAQQAVTGFDTYSTVRTPVLLLASLNRFVQAIPPVVTSVTGCTTSGAQTILCPTTGLTSTGHSITLTMVGQHFGGIVSSVTIGGNPCLGAAPLLFASEV